MKRRDFIKTAGLASTALWVPAFLKALPAGQLPRGARKLVVVQLSGGNDGLNTVVPYRNDRYYELRPALAVSDKSVLKVSDDLGLHPALQAIRPLYDAGQFCILNNVGYPNPDRSHFRSMDIWHTASDSSEYLSTGWIGRYLDSSCAGCELPYHAIEVDDSLSLALKGKHRNGFAMANARQLRRTSENRFLQAVGTAPHPADTGNVAYLYKTLAETQSSARYLIAQSEKQPAAGTFPATPFGRDLQQIAGLITADTAACIYYVSLSGFDTHANQKNQQERLLRQYAEGMAAFVKELQRHGLLDETLILTFSEFGRRVKENAGQGTDHGTANNLFLIGGKLRRPGFFNNGPDLEHLDEGDLIYQVDFRSVYASLLQDWLDADPAGILNGRFAALPLIG